MAGGQWSERFCKKWFSDWLQETAGGNGMHGVRWRQHGGWQHERWLHENWQREKWGQGIGGAAM